MRNKIELFKRYGFFFFGILTNAVGVSLITRSNLGVGPTTCIPYIISRIPSVQDFVIPLTYGTLNFLFNFILLLVQLLIQRKNFNKLQWLQLPVALLFSVFLDVAMKLTANINLDLYVYALLWTLLGCVLRAFGVSCQVLADVVMLPTEAFIKSVSDASKKEFSVCKLLMDVAMTAIGCGISFLFMHKLIGIREGTLISVLIVGPISHYFTKKMGFTTHYFENEGDLIYETKLQVKDGKRFVLTLTSEAGCGGSKIAHELGKKLNIPVYDHELIEMIAKEGNFPINFVKSHDEKLYKNAVHAFLFEHYTFGNRRVESYGALYDVQNRVIRNLAETQDCIIVGHCANSILRNNDNVISIFIYSSKAIEKEKKFSFSELFNLNNLKKTIERVNLTDERTAQDDFFYSEFYKHFTGSNWKNIDDYSFAFDASLFGTEKTIELVEEVVKKAYIENSKVKVAPSLFNRTKQKILEREKEKENHEKS